MAISKMWGEEVTNGPGVTKNLLKTSVVRNLAKYLIYRYCCGAARLTADCCTMLQITSKAKRLTQLM